MYKHLSIANANRYIVYIMNDCDYLPKFNYTVNGELREPIVFDNFLLLPIKDNIKNECVIETKFKHFDDNFFAIPFVLAGKDSDSQNLSIFFDETDSGWIENQLQIPRLQGNINGKFTIKVDFANKDRKNNTIQCIGHNGCVTCRCFRLGTPRLEYVENSYFVSYARIQNTTDAVNWLTYRNSKKIHIVCSTVINSDKKFDYCMIGDRTVSMQKIRFIRYIATPIDWINAYKEMICASNFVLKLK